MRSPFPGMDPYLEDDLWPALHQTLASWAAANLVKKLGPRYLVLPNERKEVRTVDDPAASSRPLVPDVSVFGRRRNGSGTSTAIAEPPLRMATQMPELVRVPFVEIKERRSSKLVTVIEFLSPTNKFGEGRDEYLKKRHAIFRSNAHLMEVDLLRAGQRLPMRQQLPPVPYFVFLSRAEQRPMLDVWPILLQQPLPKVPVPLLEGDADVQLDLQQVIESIYDDVEFDRAIDYSRPPVPPLTGDDEIWADKLLKPYRKRTRKK